MLKQKARLIISHTRQTKWAPHSPSISFHITIFTISFNFNPSVTQSQTTHSFILPITNYQLPITNYLSLSPACHLPQTNPFLLLLSLHPYKNNTTWLFCFVPIQEAWKSLRVVQVGITVTAAVDHQSATWLKTTSLLFSSSSP